MDPYPLWNRHFSEKRVLLLHNSDFGPITQQGRIDISRQDVAHAAQDIALALVQRGHFVSVRAVDLDDIPSLMTELMRDPPDVVVNLCESLAGQDKNEIVIPALLDAIGIPYTGSSFLGLGLSLQKEKTIELLRHAQIDVPRSVAIDLTMSFSTIVSRIKEANVLYPLIIKPAWQNASVGIDEGSVVCHENELFTHLESLHQFSNEPLILEQYVDGMEVNAAFYGNPPVVLPLHQVDFSLFPQGKFPIVGYKAKWEPQSVEYQTTRICRANLPVELEFKIKDQVEKTCQLLGIRDYGRIDFRICSKTQIPYVIDVNPNCDLSKKAGFAKAALAKGLSYESLVEEILYFAIQRKRTSHEQHQSIISSLDHSTSDKGARASS